MVQFYHRQCKTVTIYVVIPQITHTICCVKFRVLREKGVVKETDLICRFYIRIVITMIKAVKLAAQIGNRTRNPVFQILDLHLQIDDGTVIKKDKDIEVKVLVCNDMAGLNRILYFGFYNRGRIKMQQSRNKPDQGRLIFLKNYMEKIIVRHIVGYFSGRLLKRYRF